MNPRERNLLISLAVIVLCGAGLYGGKRFFWDPLQTYNAEIDQLEKANAELSDKLETFNQERKKLTLARLKSLPGDKDQAVAEYQAFLQRLFDGAGLIVEKIAHTAAQKVKVVNPIPNIKEVGHLLIPFTVRARGELAQLVRAMEQIQNTPYEHRIRSVVIDRDTRSGGSDSTKLMVTVNIDALIVAKTKRAPGLLPGIDPGALIHDAFAARSGLMPLQWGAISSVAMHAKTMPAPEGREYAKIADKNIFVGELPAPKQETITEWRIKDPLPVVKVEVDNRPSPPPEFTPRYVYLTTTLPDQQVIYLRNRIYEPADPTLSEQRVEAGSSLGGTFLVGDEDKRYIFFRAKLLKVELSHAYFQVQDNIYKVQTGQNLADAMGYARAYKGQKGQNLTDEKTGRPVTQPLNAFWLNLETAGLFDVRWAASQSGGKDKADNKGKGVKKLGAR